MRPNLGNSNWSWWAREKMKKPKKVVPEPKVEDIVEEELIDESIDIRPKKSDSHSHHKSRSKHKKRN